MTTAKQITDGCDVSGCEAIGTDGWCSFWEENCAKNPDCIHKKYLCKEQECERLKLKINSYVTITDECLRLDNKRLADEKRDLQQQLDQLKQTLIETKEVLQFYNNTKIGVDKGNGIFELEVSINNLGKLIYCYNTNPAKEALQKISEVIPDEN